MNSYVVKFTDRDLDTILGVAQDHIQVLVVSLEKVFSFCVSVQADVEYLSILMRRHLNLKVENTSLLLIILALAKIDVGDEVSRLIRKALVLQGLILRVCERAEAALNANSIWGSYASVLSQNNLPWLLVLLRDLLVFNLLSLRR